MYRVVFARRNVVARIGLECAFQRQTEDGVGIVRVSLHGNQRPCVRECQSDENVKADIKELMRINSMG